MGSKGEISEAVAAEDASSQRTGTRRTIAIVLVLTTRKLPCPTQVVPEVASLPRRHSHVRSRGASRARTRGPALPGAKAPVYGMAGGLPDRGAVGDMLLLVQDRLLDSA